MMLDQKETTVAYRCPHCGKTTLSVVGIFSLTGDLIRLKCGCGESELCLSYTAERKIRITVPCLVCSYPHTFVLGSSAFFSDRVMTYSCPMTGIELCFIGKKEDVIAASDQADRRLAEMMEEAGLSDLNAIKEPERDESDGDGEDLYFISDVIRFLLCELQEENAVDCHCEEKSMQDLQFRFITENGEQKVEVYCAACGASAVFPVNSANEAGVLLNVDTLKLF